MTTALRIFDNAVLGNGPPRPNRTPAVTATPVKPAVSIHTIIELEITRILATPPEPGESIQRAFDVKEALLRGVFETLTHDERARLHASIVNKAEGVASFLRLAPERRARLTALLANRSRV
jgi:hypothetical protein